MKRKVYKKILSLLIVALCVLTLVGCDNKKPNQVVLPDADIVEIYDEEIENAQYYLDALKHLNFREVDLEKEYSLEELTVYLMELFNLQGEALETNYQCPYKNLNKETENIIAYAYANWYLTGINSEDVIYANINTANNFIAELLRLMGYKDYGEEVDFVLGNKIVDDEVEGNRDQSATAIDFAATLGIDFNPNTGNVRGDYLAKLLWDVLNVLCKDGESVKEKLEDMGLFRESQYIEATYLVEGKEIPVVEVEEHHYTSSNSSNSASSSSESSGSSSGGGSSSGSGGGHDSGGSGTGGGTTGGDTGGGDTGGGDTGGGDTGGGSEQVGGGGGENETPAFDF